LVIPGPSRLNQVKSTLADLRPLIPDRCGIRRRGAALAVIRRHIATTEARWTDHEGASTSHIAIVIPAHMDIQRDIRRPSTRHRIRYRLPINRIVVSISPIKAEICGHIRVRYAFRQEKQQQPNPDDLKDAPSDLC
jgi:hypothetical protein